MKKEKTIKAYKAFNPDFTCNGFQYKVGKEYTHDGEVKACQSGFHACQNPFDVLHYYPLVNRKGEITRFAEVLQSGVIDNSKENKTCSSKIKVNAELNLAEFIEAGIGWIKESTNPDKIKTNNNYDSQIINSDNYTQIANNSNFAKINSSGDFAHIANSGDYIQIINNGDYIQIANSGYGTKIANSGNYAQIGSSSKYTQIASSGNYTQISSSGDDAKINSSGYSVKICNSGDYTQINSLGTDSVVCCAGYDCIVKAKIGSWITLAEWEYDEDKERYVPKCVKTEYVDGERIKGDTWYKLIDGEFVEQKDIDA